MVFCSKYALVIVLGIVVGIIGFIMTMYGHFAKPFFSESSESFCDFCKDERNTTERNAANCRIVGPIFMGLGMLLIFIGVILKRKYGESNIRGTVITYNAAGSNTTYPATQVYPQQQNTSYPPPMSQSQYPSQQHGGYPQSNMSGYPPSQGYPPPQGYPQPPTYQSQPPTYGNENQQQPYPPPNNYGQEKSGFPPPPPSYDAAIQPSAPPPGQ